jgi:hypothetical protein
MVVIVLYIQVELNIGANEGSFMMTNIPVFELFFFLGESNDRVFQLLIITYS